MTIHDFARNVKFYCEERDMSKAELAEKIGIKPASLARALHGNPQLDTIIKIADALDVKPSVIMAAIYRLQMVCCYTIVD